MNQTNILNFITRANLGGITSINNALRQQTSYLNGIAQAAAASTQQAQRMTQAWRRAGAALRMAQAGQIGRAGFQNRNAAGQFAPGFNQQAIAAALARASSFSRRLRLLLAQATAGLGAGLAQSMQQGQDALRASIGNLGRWIREQLLPEGVMAALRASVASIANSMRTLIVAAAKAAGTAIRTFMVGALHAAQRAANLVRGTLRAIRGGLGNLGIIGSLITIAGVKAGYTVDAQLAKINTIARESKDNLDLIALGLERIASTVGTTFTDNAEAYYDLLSAGLGVKNGVVDIAESMRLMNDAANLAVGGIGTMEDALDFMTTALNAFRGPLTTEFGDPLKASTAIADAFSKAVELGKVTVSELGATFSTAAPLAAQLGLDFRELAAVVAVMTQQGFDAGESFTALRSALVGNQRHAKQLADAMKDIDVSRAMKEVGAKGWLEYLDIAGFQKFALLLRAYSDKTGIPLIKLLGRIEGVQAILAVTGAQAENYVYALQQVSDASGNAAAQAALFNDSLKSQITLLGNTLFSIADQLFRRRIIDPLKQLVYWIRQGALAVLDFVVASKAFFDIIIPLFTVTTALAALTKGADAVERVFLRLGGPISGFAIGINRIAWAIALTVGPLALAWATFTAFSKAVEHGILPAKTFGRVLEDIQRIMGNLGVIAGSVVQLVQDIVAAFSSRDPERAIRGAFYRFGKVAGEALNRTTVLVRRAINGFVRSWQAFFDDEFHARAVSIGNALLDGISAIWDYVAPRIADTLGQLLTFGAEVGTTFVEFGARIASAIGQGIIEALPKVAEFIRSIPKAIGNAVSEGGLGDVIDQFTEWWQSLVDWFGIHGPQLVSGIGDVFNAVGDLLRYAIPKALGKAGDILGGLFDNVLANRDQILAAVGNFIRNVVNALGELAGAIIPPLAEAAGHLIDWIAVDVIPFIGAAVANFIDSVVRFLVPLGSDSGPVAGAMADVGGQLISWITDRIPGTLRALLEWAIEIENWILTTLAPRIVAVLLGLGVKLVEALWNGLVWAIQNPGDALRTVAQVIYALLAARLILTAATAAGVIVGGAFHLGVAGVKMAGAVLARMAHAVLTSLTTAGVSAATAAGLATSAAFVAAVGIPIVATILVALKVQSDISAAANRTRSQVAEFVKTSTLQGTEDGLRAVQAAQKNWWLYLPFFDEGGKALDEAEITLMRRILELGGNVGDEFRDHPLPVPVTVLPYYTWAQQAGQLGTPGTGLPSGLTATPDVELQPRYRLEGNVEERIQQLIDQRAALGGIGAQIGVNLGATFNFDAVVKQFKDGTSAIVDEWNSLPSQMKSTAELLREALEKPFSLKKLIKSFKADYALILQAMQSGNPLAIAYARVLSGQMIKMAEDTNAAFIAAGKSPPFFVDKLSGTVIPITKDGQRIAKEIGWDFGTAIPNAVGAAGDAISGLPTTIDLATPAAIGATGALVGGIVSRLGALPARFAAAGASAALFSAAIRAQAVSAGGAAGALIGAVFAKLKPTPDTLTRLYNWGWRVAGAWVIGVIARLGAAAAAIGAAAAIAMSGLQPGGSPPKTGPLRTIDEWGVVIGETWVDGVVAGLESGPTRIARAVAAVGAELNRTLGTSTVPISLAYAQGPTRPIGAPSSSDLRSTSGRGQPSIRIGTQTIHVTVSGERKDARQVGQAVRDEVAAAFREETARTTTTRVSRP